jgi:hypothetical protein
MARLEMPTAEPRYRTNMDRVAPATGSAGEECQPYRRCAEWMLTFVSMTCLRGF